MKLKKSKDKTVAVKVVNETLNVGVTAKPCLVTQFKAREVAVPEVEALCKAAAALKEHGAAQVIAYCTHAVLSGPAVTNIESSQLDELVVTNTIPLREDAAACSKIRQLSIAGLLAESIRRINNEESVSSLFVD